MSIAALRSKRKTHHIGPPLRVRRAAFKDSASGLHCEQCELFVPLLEVAARPADGPRHWEGRRAERYISIACVSALQHSREAHGLEDLTVFVEVCSLPLVIVAVEMAP